MSHIDWPMYVLTFLLAVVLSALWAALRPLVRAVRRRRARWVMDRKIKRYIASHKELKAPWTRLP